MFSMGLHFQGSHVVITVLADDKYKNAHGEAERYVDELIPVLMAISSMCYLLLLQLIYSIGNIYCKIHENRRI